MQLHELQPKHKKKARKRIGRGGKRGTYSGKGIKGQRSRSGNRMPPIVRELIKRYPKLRGYRFKSNSYNEVVNIGVLEKNFGEGEAVTSQSLLAKKLVRRIKGRAPKVKILGNGKLTKKLTVRVCLVSASAKEAIEKAKGTIR